MNPKFFFELAGGLVLFGLTLSDLLKADADSVPWKHWCADAIAAIYSGIEHLSIDAVIFLFLNTSWGGMPL